MLKTERVALGLTAVLSLVLAFLVYQEHESLVPYGSRQVFTISQLPAGMGQAEAAEAVQEVAEELDTVFYRMAANPEALTQGWLLYAFGPPDHHMVSYPNFGPERHTQILRPSELGVRDIRGDYATPLADIGTAIERFLERGIVIGPSYGAYDGYDLEVAKSSAAGPIAGMCLAALFLSIAHGTVVRRRRDAILVVHGNRVGAGYIKDLGVFTGQAVITVGAVAVVALLVLGFYNQWRQIDAFGKLAGAVLLAVIAAAMAFHMIGYLLRPPLRIVALLRREHPSAYSSGLAVGAQALVLVLAFGSITALTLSMGRLAEAGRFDSYWLAAKDMVALSPTEWDPTNDKDQKDAIKFVVDQCARGRAFLVHQGEDYVAGRDLNPGAYPGENSTMLVTPSFLDVVPVKNAAGEAIQWQDIKSFQVLIPEHLAGQAPAFVEGGKQWAEFEALEMQGRAVAGVPLEPAVTYIESGQEVFTFADDWTVKPLAWIDPVIYVVPPDLGILSPSNLMTFTLDGWTFFEDQAAVKQAIDAGWFDKWRVSVFNPTTRAVDQMAQMRAKAVGRVAALVVGAVVLVFAAAVAASAYCLRNRAALFSRYVHGYRLGAEALPPALMGGAIGAAVLSVMWAGGSVPNGPAMWYCGLAVALSAGIIWLVTRLWLTATRADWVKRY